MAGGVTITIYGLNEVIGEIQAFDLAAQARVGEKVEETVKRTKARVKAAAPRASGKIIRTRKGVRTEYEPGYGAKHVIGRVNKRELSGTVSLLGKSYFLMFEELGTRGDPKRKIPARPARPFFGPIWAEEGPKFVEEVDKAIKGA